MTEVNEERKEQLRSNMQKALEARKKYKDNPELRKKKKTRKITPLKAIKLKCIDCSGGKPSEVKHCPVKDCPLWRFRLGRKQNEVKKAGETKKNNPEPQQDNAGRKLF